METTEKSMLDRMPGELLIHKVVMDYAYRPRQSWLARFFGVPPIPANDLSWFTGAQGERIVARTLSGLPAGWHVFHSLPVGSDESDIDHVVVGPPGVYTINTKHHAGKTIWVGGGTFMVNGQRQPYIRNAEHEAIRLTKMLRARFSWAPAVHPVIAVVNSKSITVKSPPRVVHIDGGRTILRWLKKQRSVFTAETIEEIADFLADPQNWRVEDPPDRAELTRQFERLSIQVKRAQSIQTAWKLFAIVAAIVAVLALVNTLA